MLVKGHRMLNVVAGNPQTPIVADLSRPEQLRSRLSGFDPRARREGLSLTLIDPLVSVIIPTFDRPEYLAAAVHSVLRQRAQDFEVLVVDDGSATNVLPV